MLPKPLSAVLLLCEKALNEADGVVSAIRLGDLYYIPDVPDVPPEKKGAGMTILAMVKFEADDVSTHTITLVLERPDGTKTDLDLGIPLKVPLADLTPKVPDAPRGFNLIAPWGVKATQMGLHQLRMYVDGEEVATTFFTLAPPLVSRDH